MFFDIRRAGGFVLGSIIIIGTLSGCVQVNPNPAAPTVSVALPTISVDTSKSIAEQVKEFNQGFATVYCRIRTQSDVNAFIAASKEAWNALADRARSEGTPLPTFNPDATTCPPAS